MGKTTLWIEPRVFISLNHFRLSNNEHGFTIGKPDFDVRLCIEFAAVQAAAILLVWSICSMQLSCGMVLWYEWGDIHNVGLVCEFASSL